MNPSGRVSIRRPTRATRLLSASLLAVWLSIGLSAQTTSEEAPIPGGTMALARALGVDPVPDRARFVSELTRVIYEAPEGASADGDALVRTLTHHLEAIDRFQSALAKVQTGDGTIALALAAQKNRNRLMDFLDLAGLKLRERQKVFTVERADNKQAVERVTLLGHLGIDSGQLAARLNQGEAVHVEVPTETVPIPLSAKLWSEAVFGRPVDVNGLFSAVLGNRRAALLGHGLAALDEETLRFLADRPSLVTHLYDHEVGVFAAFAGGLRIRQGSISVPGGESAVAMWEAVVEEELSRPDRFIRELFSQRGGRVAYLYDALTYLDASTRAFVLGLWMKDAGLRVERLNALLTSLEAFPGWSVPERPFARPQEDAIVLLTRIAADANGAPRAPLWRSLWSHVFDGIDLPSDAARQLKNVKDEGPIDAAWLADAVLAAEPRFRGERLDQLAFGQRAFAAAEDTALPDVLVALRAFPRYRMLMLTLERMGVKSPSAYALAARHAQRLSKLDPNRAYLALSQFQGSLAILARLVRVHRLDPANAERLVASLAAAAPDDEGAYAGAVARWMRDSLGPFVGATADNIDDVMVAALAGPRQDVGPASVRVSWEDRAYRVDFATPEARRLTQVLERLRAESISRALSLEAVAETLSAPNLTLADLPSLGGRLKELAAALTRKDGKTTGATAPPGIDPPRNQRETVGKATENLARISKPKDMKKAVHIAEPLFHLVDDVLAEALRALAYALDLGDPAGTTLSAGNVSQRHDFGFAEKAEEVRRRTPWAEPVENVQPSVPWRVTGSLLGLDLGLSALALRRISFEGLSEAPVLRSAERITFSKTVALLSPMELRDTDLDVIAEGVTRGRQRVTELTPEGEGFDAMADEIAMDGWRRRAVRWALTHDPEHTLSFFSMTDLLYLGKPAAGQALDAWGTAADAYDGCICTRLPSPGRWSIMTGRPRSGVLSTQVADLNLRVALALRELKLPAALAKGVLAAAVQDYIDRVKPLHMNDWLTLVRSAQAVPTDRIADYVAGLVTNGPLIPDSGADASGQRH